MNCGFGLRVLSETTDIMESSSATDHSNVKRVTTNGVRYVEYNVYGNLFQVSPKYVPPIRPVGRGAYGFVW